MDFLSDYWTYHKCYEIPRSYALWSGVGLLSSIIHRKVIFLHGDIEIHAPMYIGLIGPQGISKSTSCGFARNFFRDACPDGNIGPSRASPESLCTNMNAKDFPRVYTNWEGDQIEVRPYAFFINEFKNFVGRSPFDMITFLTDIYDQKVYDASTIARGLEPVINPAVSILMCETPDWFIKNIRGDIISGGIARRFVLVYEMEDPQPLPFINLTPDAQAAKERIRQRLVDVRKVTGRFQWGDAARLYEKWYIDCFNRRAREQNGVMRGYLKSKHIQLFKVMMLLDAVSDKPMFIFSTSLLEEGLSLLDSVERNMPKLSLAAGRNEMLGPQLKIIEILQKNDGWLPEKQLRREIESELDGIETFRVLRHLEETDQIVKREFKIPNQEGVLVQRTMVLLPDKYAAMKNGGEIKVTVRKPGNV